MLNGRRADHSDAVELAFFQCADGPGPAEDVESWIGELLDWQEEADGREVLVFFEEDGTLVGVVAYRYLIDGEPSDDYFIYLMAVSIEAQRNEASYGTTMLRTLFFKLASKSPGGLVVWMVASDNTPCQAFCHSRLQLEPSSPPEHRGFLEYSITLDHPDAYLQ